MPVKFKIKDPVQNSWSLLQLTCDSLLKCSESSLFKTNNKLTPQQFSVLAAIKSIGDPVLPTDVASWLDRNTNTITLSVDRMEKDGLVSRIRDLKDRRAIRLVVSPLGQKLYEQAVKPSHEVARTILSVLSKEELEALDKLMEKIRQKSFEYRQVEDKVKDEKDLKKHRPELKEPLKKKK